jgi:hypothetical protein
MDADKGFVAVKTSDKRRSSAPHLIIRVSPSKRKKLKEQCSLSFFGPSV